MQKVNLHFYEHTQQPSERRLLINLAYDCIVVCIYRGSEYPLYLCQPSVRIYLNLKDRS